MSPPVPHLHTADEVAAHWGVDVRHGLSAAEVAQRQRQHGPNQLAEAPPRRWWQRLLAPLSDFMTLVLLLAAVVSGVVGDVSDTVVIVVIVLLNAGIAITQEWRADQALQALKRLSAAQATVRRDGQHQGLSADQLVPGDVVLLEAGQLVPADLRLHEVARLQVDESALTGESVTVAKHSQPLSAPPPGADHALGDRLNMAWRGTVVTHGRASGVVVATGGQTQLGQVAGLLGAQHTPQTPLQKRLADFGRRLSLLVLALCLLMFGLGLLRGEPLWQMALTAISLAVAAIPEALPAVVTVLLALGARRLVQVRALVRHLPAVETLGSVSTICSDKTGTLTQNRMQVQALWLGCPGDANSAERALWQAAVLCNDAQPAGPAQPGDQPGDPLGNPPPQWHGDPTETALLVQAQAAGLAPQALRQAGPRQLEWPFDAERKRMTTLHRHPDPTQAAQGAWRSYTKGAPESVLPRCVDWADGRALDKPAALAQAEQLAAHGMRVLALAQRDGHSEVAAVQADAQEQGLRLLGLVAMMDPPRPEAQAAVAQCQAAGIRPVMITGDHPATAVAIARQLGICPPAATPGQAVGQTTVMTGPELAKLDDAALAAVVGQVAVYARMDPAQKIRIVQALQASGAFVAMTGDGVNDAPALKAADIGVAMGQGGTDVARQAASLVLLDDHFATIVAAVREGRRIFDNIRKFIRYVMTGNSAEIWVLLLAPLLGLPLPLLPIHILWINLVTDGLPGLALAAEPAERGVMQRPPRPPGQSVLADGLGWHTLWVGWLMAGACLAVFAWALHQGGERAAAAPSLVFTALTLAQMMHLLAIRSETEPLWRLGLRSNLPLLLAVLGTVLLQLATLYLPGLSDLLQTRPLDGLELALCAAVALVVWLAVELEKAWRRSAARTMNTVF